MRGVALASLALLLLCPTAAAAFVTLHAGTNPDGSMYITPKSVQVTKGDKVHLVLVNDDPGTPHDWALLSYGGKDIEVYTEGGATKAVDFTADAAGDFRIVCQVVGHKQRGMEGTFTVRARGLPAPGVPALLALAALFALARRR
jgi:uncharacterized cupredoxin-like copper-binding protein